jgi:hypothetical protein
MFGASENQVDPVKHLIGSAMLCKRPGITPSLE